MDNMIIDLPVDELYEHPDNPRPSADFDDDETIGELADSIKANGVLQNLTVMKGRVMANKDRTVKPNGYTVIIGHRRLAAAKRAGLKTVSCRVIEELSLVDAISMMCVENIQRVDIPPIEQAWAFAKMRENGDDVKTIARKSGFSEATVYNRLKIAELDRNKLKRASKNKPELEKQIIHDGYHPLCITAAEMRKKYHEELERIESEPDEYGFTG